MFLLYITLLGHLFSIASGANKDRCPAGTKLFEHNDGSLECLVCSICPRGKVKIANCTVDRDTVCEPCEGLSYYNDTEPHCRPCTVCPPGEFLKSQCSQFLDTACEACPKGTFAPRQNSSGCENCTICDGLPNTECDKIHDTKCNQTGTLPHGKGDSGLTGIVVGLAVVILVMICLVVNVIMYRHRKLCWSKRDGIHRKTFATYSTEGTRDENEKAKLFVVTDTEKQLELDPKTNFKEMKEKQMEQEDDLKNLSPYEQLNELSSSVGELVSSKNLMKGSSKDYRYQAVCFVGSKFIMTAYLPVRDICGTTEMGSINHLRFDDDDVYVTFHGNEKFRIRASAPAYTNKFLDIIVLEIYLENTGTESSKISHLTSNSKTEDNENTSHFPLPFCLHTSLPYDGVETVDITFFDDSDGKKVHARRNNTIYHLNSPLQEAYNYLTENNESLNQVLNKLEKNVDVLDHNKCILDVGKTRLCLTTFRPESFIGSPGFIEDNRDKCCRLLCICNGRVPSYMKDLPLEHQRKLKQVDNVRIGTLVSEVYKDMKINNPSLAAELFYEFHKNQ